MITVIVFLIVLSILVLIHELGHFLVAKKFGVKVEEFGFGLPPRVFGVKRGETIYSLNLLPIGGFVKLYGEDGVKKDKRAFSSRPVWQRAAIVVAGVAMNFVLAVLIISYLFTQGIPVPKERVHLEGVAKGGPAEAVGLRKGDVLLEIDGRKVEKTADALSYTKEKLGQKVTLRIQREKERLSFEIVPRKEYPKDEGPMGIVISNIEKVTYPLYQAPFLGTLEALKLSFFIGAGVAVLLWQFIVQGVVPTGVAGPVGIAQVTGQAVTSGAMAVISLTGILSLNLAVLNILPIPALDGGRLLFIAIEAVLRRRVNPHLERYAHTIGMILLLLIIALITFRDITRLFTGKSLVSP